MLESCSRSESGRGECCGGIFYPPGLIRTVTNVLYASAVGQVHVCVPPYRVPKCPSRRVCVEEKGDAPLEWVRSDCIVQGSGESGRGCCDARPGVRKAEGGRVPLRYGRGVKLRENIGAELREKMMPAFEGRKGAVCPLRYGRGVKLRENIGAELRGKMMPAFEGRKGAVCPLRYGRGVKLCKNGRGVKLCENGRGVKLCENIGAELRGKMMPAFERRNGAVCPFGTVAE